MVRLELIFGVVRCLCERPDDANTPWLAPDRASLPHSRRATVPQQANYEMSLFAKTSLSNARVVGGSVLVW